MTENPSPETLVGDAQLTSANGGGTVESPALTLADLNAQLGSNFKDTATAIQSLKETKNFVGRRKEDIAAEVRASLIPATPTNVASKSEVQDINNRLFLSENPQFKNHVEMLQRINPDFAEAAKVPGLQDIIDKASKVDEVAKNKSVVASNSRLSQVKSVVENAINTSNARGSTNEDTALIFAQAINSGMNER